MSSSGRCWARTGRAARWRRLPGTTVTGAINKPCSAGASKRHSSSPGLAVRISVKPRVGQPLPGELPSGMPLGAGQFGADLPAGLPSDLLIRRPDVRAAEQQLIASDHSIGAARASFFPRITLTANAGVTSSDLGNLLTSGRFALTGAAQLLQPLFDAGRNQAGLDLAQVNREVAVAQYEKAIQIAFREVADALAGRETLGEQLRAQRAQADAELQRSRLAELRYRNGAASFLDVLDAQRSLFQAQQATLQLSALQAQNLVTLYKVLGGGWQEPTAAR